MQAELEVGPFRVSSELLLKELGNLSSTPGSGSDCGYETLDSAHCFSRMTKV